jgi:hypothetical protein
VPPESGLVAERRTVVRKVAEPYKRGTSEGFSKTLASIQHTIDAVDQALIDEERLLRDGK